MTELVLRKISFDFDDVPFIWNPENPEFSLLANVLSFEAVGFERFICRSMQEAKPYIKDPELESEVRDFCTQEMVHSQAHLMHVRSLSARYPKLKDVLEETNHNFDNHWAAHDLRYRLAYSAIIEATSLPLYRVILNHRARLLAGGDPRVVSLLLWHICEEIEHRSSALLVYNQVIGLPWYRLKVFPHVGRHLAENTMRIAARFVEHVPEAKGLDVGRAMARLPLWARTWMTVKLVTSQMPWYNPAAHRTPRYCREWAGRYAAGEDMSCISAT